MVAGQLSGKKDTVGMATKEPKKPHNKTTSPAISVQNYNHFNIPEVIMKRNTIHLLERKNFFRIRKLNKDIKKNLFIVTLLVHLLYNTVQS